MHGLPACLLLYPQSWAASTYPLFVWDSLSPVDVAVRSPALLPAHSFCTLYYLEGELTRCFKELFNVQIGKVARVTLTYGQDGKSKGVATIQFAQKGDAKKAYDRYDGKLIDNSKRLKVHTPYPWHCDSFLLSLFALSWVASRIPFGEYPLSPVWSIGDCW